MPTDTQVVRVYFGLAYEAAVIGRVEINVDVGDSLRNAEPSGAKGSDRSRIPVAEKIAFPTAGASPTIGVSPAPADGKSLRSSISISISGISLNRGTRYSARCGLSMRPFLK